MIETLIPRMVEICGPSGVVSDPLELRTYECDGLTSHRAAPALAVLPETAEQSRTVGRVPALGDDAFETALPGGREHVSAGHVTERVAGRERPAGQAERLKAPAALVVGQLKQRLAVQMQHVEDDIADRGLARLPGDLGAARQMHALLQLAEAGPPVGAERDDFPVEDGRTCPELLPYLAQLRISGRDVLAAPAEGPDPATVRVDDSPDAVPFDLVGPAFVVGRQCPGHREHGRDPVRKRLEAFPGRSHAMDHPVLPAGREQDVAAAGLRPVQHDLDLRVGPLLELVLAVIPDADVPAAVLAFRDVTFEASVLKRMVFGTDGEMVRGRVFRDPQ